MSNRKRLVIIGAGGQAREVRWIADDISKAGAQLFEFVGCVLSDLAAAGPRDSRERILGDLSWLRANRTRFDALALGIGTPAARLRVAAELEREFTAEWWPALIHPRATYDERTCRFGHGTLVCPGVVATVNVVLEPHAMANTNVTIGHESHVGRGCVINPGASLSGGVVLGDGVLVGTGAQVLQYRTVSEGATIGAGAVVVKDVPPGETVVGVPARRLERKGTP